MFRKIPILLLLLSISVIAAAQSLTNLDTAYGFRQFKFRLKPTEIKDLKQVRTSIYKKDFVREYAYTGNDITELNTVQITGIILSFYENRLFGIRISYDSSSPARINDDFNKIQYGLSAKYGTGWTTAVTDVPDITGRTWKAGKVVIDNIMSATGYGYINLIERKTYKEVMADK